MPKTLLDTDILSEYLKGYDRNVIRRAGDYARQHGVFTFTSVTVHEIVYGLELKDAAAQLQKSFALVEPERTNYADLCRLPPSRHHQGRSP